MANALYNSARQLAATTGIGWGTADIRAVLVDLADYTVDLVNHDALDDIPAGARVATAALTGETVAAGVMDASDLVFSSVTGDPCEAVVVYVHTGTAATSTLLFYIDTATGLPVTPNGGDINIAWSNGADKIARL